MSENKENLLDQGSKDLLQKSGTVKGVTTEVTSIQAEEKKTGQKIPVPSAEELVARASSSLLMNKKLLNDLVTAKNGEKYRVSRKAMNRVLLSILDLPTAGLPVSLKSEEEKMAFAIGQKLIADRFILTHYHIMEERKKQELEKQQQSTDTKSEDTNQ